MIGKCDCCSREGRELHVRASATGPMSMGYCVACLTQLAEPEWTFEYLYNFVGTKGEGLADWVKALWTWKDGTYWSWDKWIVWRKEPGDIQKALDTKFEEQMRRMNDDNLS